MFPYQIKSLCQVPWKNRHAHPFFFLPALTFQMRENVDIIQSRGFIRCSDSYGDALNSMTVKQA